MLRTAGDARGASRRGEVQLATITADNVAAAPPHIPRPQAATIESAPANNIAGEFEACCRALSHKANTALLEQLPLLQHGALVDLTRNYVGALGLQAISVVLPQNPNLTELRAPRNGLTNDAIVLFCRAMRGHGQLAAVDFSANTDISLAGGLALLSLAQQMPSLRVVRLDGTHVPPAVLAKLSRALEQNTTRAAAMAAAGLEARPSAGNGSVIATTTVARTTVCSSAATAAAATRGSRASASAGSGPDRRGAEDAVLTALTARVRAAVKDGYQLPPPSLLTGWRVLEVSILAPPFLFDTEIALLCNGVFPRLNREFARHRVVLRPVVVMGSRVLSSGEAGLSTQRTAGSYNRELHFLPLCDVTAAVKRGRFAAIELIGDRPGDYAQISAQAMLDLQRYSVASDGRRRLAAGGEEPPAESDAGSDAAKAGDDSPMAALQPVLYEAHKTALQTAQWLLVAARRETRALQVPAALAPLLTADPGVAHPDRHRTMVREIVYDEAMTANAHAPGGAKATLTAAAAGAQSDTIGTTKPTAPDAEGLATPPPPGAAVAPSASATHAIPRTVEWDYGCEEYHWKRHVAWREHVVSTAPVPELVLAQYSATFDCTDTNGGVRLRHLEDFQSSIYERLRAVVHACVVRSETPADAAQGATSRKDESVDDIREVLRRIGVRRAWTSTYIQALAATSSSAAKKNLMNRIILYAANPPSRNMLLLHGNDLTGLAMLMVRGANRLQSLQYAYTLAIHSVRSTLLLEEPTDIHSFVLHIVSQLTTDAGVLRYIRAEVDLERLCAFCMQILSGNARGDGNGLTSAITAAGLPAYVAQYVMRADDAAPVPKTVHDALNLSTSASTPTSKTNGGGGGAESTHAFVVVVDGIDRFDTPVLPCGALLHAHSGAAAGSNGSRAELVNWSEEESAGTASTSDGGAANAAGPRTRLNPNAPLDSLLPRALARQVRLIASCATSSAAFASLRHLGRDSVEALALGPVSANEVEQYLSPFTLSRMGLTFSEDDFECARGKTDAAMAEYMRYLLDAARSASEAPGFLTQSQVIQAFPDTLAAAAQWVYDRLVNAFGLPLTRNVLGLLTASRWGLTTLELRALLPQLTACRLEELLRMLRPVLEPEVPPEASAVMGPGSGNALIGTVRILAPSFRDVMNRESMQLVAEEQQMDYDQRVWHTQLAQYYLSIVYRSLRAAPSSPSARPLHETRDGADRVTDASVVRATLDHMDELRSQPEVPAQQRRAMKEVIYHMTHSGDFWPQLDVTVLSLSFLQRVYELGLGYAYLRDLTAAFNERYQRHLLGEDIGEASWQQLAPDTSGGVPAEPSTTTADQTRPSNAAATTTTTATASEAPRYALPTVLRRMRDYVRFAHQHGLQLSLRPSLVAQFALQIPASQLNSVQRDTVTFLYRQLQQDRGVVGSAPAPVFFTLSTPAATTAKQTVTHLAPITCAAFLPNRKFIVTASRDRSLAWVNPQTGSATWYARQPTAAIESLTVCRTSAYVAAVSEDRTVWIYDGLQGKLVAQCRGSDWFDAPIASVVFSARGRFLWVGTTDTRAHCFECETGRLRCTMGVQELLVPRRKRVPVADESSSTAADATAPQTPLVDGVSTEDEEDDEEHSRHAEMVQHSTTEWRRRRNYLHILPDAQDDALCVTVLAHEVRCWQLYPWDEKEEGEEDDAAAAGGAPAKKGVKGAERTIAYKAIMRCRVREPASLSHAAAAAAPSASSAVGYKLMQAWQPSEAVQSGLQSASVAYTFATPLSCSGEVHLLVFRFPEMDGKSITEAVRCTFSAATTAGVAAGSGEERDVAEISVMCASPDGRWLAAGTTGGVIGLFDVESACRTWQLQQQQEQQQHDGTRDTSPLLPPSPTSVRCTPTCVFTSMKPTPGLVAAPIRAITFHRDGRLLFGLGRSLQCWRVPDTTNGDSASETTVASATQQVGEYVWTTAPTCFSTLPVAMVPNSDVELPSNIAELGVGDDTGRLTLLKLWKPTP